MEGKVFKIICVAGCGALYHPDGPRIDHFCPKEGEYDNIQIISIIKNRNRTRIIRYYMEQKISILKVGDRLSDNEITNFRLTINGNKFSLYSPKNHLLDCMIVEASDLDDEFGSQIIKLMPMFLERNECYYMRFMKHDPVELVQCVILD